jgi:hypothetical protein
MYQLDQNVQENAGNYFTVGIHENVTLKDVTLETASNGNPYIKFLFVGEGGEEVFHTEFGADPTRDDFQKKLKNFLIRIKHICTKFVPEAAVNINAPTLEAFATQLSAILKPNLPKTKVRLKLVFNNKNYPSVPMYVPFIEAMAIPKTESKLKLDPNFDKLVKEEGTNPTLSSGTPGVGAPAQGGVDPNLPF